MSITVENTEYGHLETGSQHTSKTWSFWREGQGYKKILKSQKKTPRRKNKLWTFPRFELKRQKGKPEILHYITHRVLGIIGVFEDKTEFTESMVQIITWCLLLHVSSNFHKKLNIVVNQSPVRQWQFSLAIQPSTQIYFWMAATINSHLSCKLTVPSIAHMPCCRHRIWLCVGLAWLQC